MCPRSVLVDADSASVRGRVSKYHPGNPNGILLLMILVIIACVLFRLLLIVGEASPTGLILLNFWELINRDLLQPLHQLLYISCVFSITEQAYELMIILEHIR